MPDPLATMPGGAEWRVMPDALGALAAVEREEGVAVLFAAESGSRAWGFPSPDSDWDVRFIYARPLAGYLRVHPGRDVIERPDLPGDLDLSGWDLRKALALLVKGNCAIREWLDSPIVYRQLPALADELRGLAGRVPARAAARHHYRSLAVQVRARWLQRRPFPLKKYLYALRPALALRWLAEHPVGAPPMDLPALVAAVGLTAVERAAISVLVEAKRAASEMGDGRPDPVLDALIDRAIEWAGTETEEDRARSPSVEVMAEADRIMRLGAYYADAMCGGGDA